jgi:hypothetical protein
MRKLIALSTLTMMFSNLGMAATNYQLFCSSNRGRSALSIYTNNQRVYVSYQNSLGAIDFPLYEGVVTRATIPYVNIAEKELKDLDYEAVVSWPLPQCEFNEQNPMLMRCGGESLFHRPEGTALQSLGFSTNKVTEEGVSNVYEMVKIRWQIQGADFLHFLGLTFDPSQCQVRYKKD